MTCLPACLSVVKKLKFLELLSKENVVAALGSGIWFVLLCSGKCIIIMCPELEISDAAAVFYFVQIRALMALSHVAYYFISEGPHFRLNSIWIWVSWQTKVARNVRALAKSWPKSRQNFQHKFRLLSWKEAAACTTTRPAPFSCSSAVARRRM